MPPRHFSSIAFTSSGTEEADRAAKQMRDRYGDTSLDSADVVVALGGDGLMLETLHRVMPRGTPVYGINHGSIGFLMNEPDDRDLIERLGAAAETKIYPLLMRVTDIHGAEVEAYAFNEVSLFRTTYQTAKIRVEVDDQVRMEELFCDGVLVSTPAGSTAYNLSAHGPILPINSSLLALTPISAFRPRRWHGAILPNRAKVVITVLETAKRPVSAVADKFEFKDAARVEVVEDRTHWVTLLFDVGHELEERVLKEQFQY